MVDSQSPQFVWIFLAAEVRRWKSLSMSTCPKRLQSDDAQILSTVYLTRDITGKHLTRPAPDLQVEVQGQVIDKGSGLG